MSIANRPESPYEEAVAEIITKGFVDPRRGRRVSRYLEYHRNRYKLMCADPALTNVERVKFLSLCRQYL